MSQDSTREEQRRRLTAYFESGSKGAAGCELLGVEIEHHVITDWGEPVSYEGTEVRTGVREVLDHLSQWYPQQTFNAYRDLLGLLGAEGSVTLEPAAQLELSCAPYARVSNVARSYRHFRERVDPFLEGHGAHLVAVGYHPTCTAQQLTLIPKKRYDFMDAYFAHIGSHGDRMMRASASTQVSIDYEDEADAVRKMRVACALAPVLAAIADNTPTFEAEPNHTPLRRLQLWREVDGLRCGTVPGIFEEGFGFEAYADWLLCTPPIFVTRPSADEPQGPHLRPFFDEPATSAYADAPLDGRDVEHLVSMFWPDVRLKRFVEVRPADSLPQEAMLGYVALVKGLFYNEGSLATIEEALGVNADAAQTRGAWPLEEADVTEAIVQVQAHGFAGTVYGRGLASWEELLFALARGALDAEEHAYLEPLAAFAEEKPWWNAG